MPVELTIAGILLVVGPLVGAIPVANPSLMRVWSALREDHLAIIGAHRVAWTALNAGFVLATIATTAALAILALDAGGDAGRQAALVAVAATYGIAGALWCAVLAIRARTTPLLADMVRDGRQTEPAESLVGAAQGGLFAGFVLATGVALAGLGLVLLVTGGIAAPIAIACLGVGLGSVVWLLATGDVIPAVLYVPTLLVGVGLLAGWT